MICQPVRRGFTSIFRVEHVDNTDNTLYQTVKSSIGSCRAYKTSGRLLPNDRRCEDTCVTYFPETTP